MSQVTYGGQAVIEGVMMKSKTLMATAVRKECGDIVVSRREVVPWSKRFPILRLPFFRGSLAMIETMIVGYQSLTFSANQFAGEQDVELKPTELAGMMVFAFALSIGLFIALPAFLLRFIQQSINNNVLLNLVEGLVKVSIFVIYLSGTSLLKDIKRVFSYHGAEHKAINAYEAGVPLTPENAMAYSRIHKRCSTSFLFIVLIVSIFVFSFFGRPPLPLRVLLHIAILPVVAGISFELLFASAKKQSPLIIKALTIPGLWLQRLTTNEPDSSMVEVAIRALREVLPPDDPQSLHHINSAQPIEESDQPPASDAIMSQEEERA